MNPTGKSRPNQYFTWEEPKAFLKALDGQESPELSGRGWWQKLWPNLGVVLIFALIGLFSGAVVDLKYRWRNSFQAEMGWHVYPVFHYSPIWSSVPMVFLCLIMMFVESRKRYRSRIVIFDCYILRVRGNFSKKIRFADLASFSIRSEPLFSTLVLTYGNLQSGFFERPIFIGVPNVISNDQLSNFLSERISVENS